jgi:hypothetical protein
MGHDPTNYAIVAKSSVAQRDVVGSATLTSTCKEAIVEVHGVRRLKVWALETKKPSPFKVGFTSPRSDLHRV